VDRFSDSQNQKSGRSVSVVMSGFAMKTAGCSLTGIVSGAAVRLTVLLVDHPLYGFAQI
jgi:hypothetical protein